MCVPEKAQKQQPPCGLWPLWATIAAAPDTVRRAQMRLVAALAFTCLSQFASPEEVVVEDAADGGSADDGASGADDSASGAGATAPAAGLDS